MYVNLIDAGMSRQVMKSDVRRLPLAFGHYPPMVVKATIRGAVIHRMDRGKVDQFQNMIRNIDYLARCQITTCTEPFQIVLCHPKYEFMNMCSFLLAPRRGQPSQEGVWIPREIAKQLERENGFERNDYDDSGADSDFLEDEEEEDAGWDYGEGDDYAYLRSFPPACKIFRMSEDEFMVERIENERIIYLTSKDMLERRREAEEYLTKEKESLESLPDVWMAYGTSCSVFHQGTMKRASCCGEEGSTIQLLLIDYGISIEVSKSDVYNIPNKDEVNMEPFVTLVSIKSFPFIHYSRVKILQELLPRGTPVKFHRDRKCKEIPTKGEIYQMNGTSVEQSVSEIVSSCQLDLECNSLLPSRIANNELTQLLAYCINYEFMYKSPNVVIYKKSKRVKSHF